MFRELVEGARRNPIWFGSIGALSAVQGWLSWEFWGAFTEAPAEQAGLRAAGLAFVSAEVVALDMGSRAALQGEQTRANTLRAMWLSFALLNLGVDINALSRVLQTVEVARADEAAAIGAGAERARELRTLIDEADDPFPQGRLLTVEAYDVALRSKDREIELAERAPRWRQRQLERERGALETARASAAQVATWRTELTALVATPEAAEAPPPSGAAEFEPLARVLSTLTGARVGGEDVRTTLSIAAVIAMKIMLTLGIWAGLDRRGPTQPKANADAAVPAPRPVLALPAPRRGAATIQRFGRNGVQR